MKTIDLATFTDCPHLIELDLSFNSLSKIKLTHRFESLRLLNLSNNRVEAISVDLSFSSRLQILDLSFNNLKHLNYFDFNELIYLNLNDNFLRNLNDYFQINKTNQLVSDHNCNELAPPMASSSVFNRIELYVNNNKWICDCDSFDLIMRLNSNLATANERKEVCLIFSNIFCI